jgi:hypothetical protein
MRLHIRLALLFAIALEGCTPSIGDKCVLSTDCSLRGDRLCDNSQPNGYCTVFNCRPDTCPNSAACVLFHPEVPGCPYSDRSPSRIGRQFCMAQCQSDSDCRQGDGYVCVDPRQPPWSALILDDDQSQHVCIPAPSTNSAPDTTDAAVCGPVAPDASFPPFDAGADGGSDAADAGVADAIDSG